jgi:hypothetical protein
MNIPHSQLQGKPRKIGRYNGGDVYEAHTKGGLYVVMAQKGAKSEPLGTGPHRAVARHIAKQNTQGKLEITEMSKSDWLSPQDFAFMLPKYEALTEQMRKSQGY